MTAESAKLKLEEDMKKYQYWAKISNWWKNLWN